MLREYRPNPGGRGWCMLREYRPNPGGRGGWLTYTFERPRKHQSDARDLMVKPSQPRGDSLHRPGGGGSSRYGTPLPASSYIIRPFRCRFAVVFTKWRMKRDNQTLPTLVEHSTESKGRFVWCDMDKPL